MPVSETVTIVKDKAKDVAHVVATTSDEKSAATNADKLNAVIAKTLADLCVKEKLPIAKSALIGKFKQSVSAFTPAPASKPYQKEINEYLYLIALSECLVATNYQPSENELNQFHRLAEAKPPYAVLLIDLINSLLKLREMTPAKDIEELDRQIPTTPPEIAIAWRFSPNRPFIPIVIDTPPATGLAANAAAYTGLPLQLRRMPS